MLLQGPVLFSPSFQIAVYHSEGFVGRALFTCCLIWRFGETVVSQAPHYVLPRNSGQINGGYVAQSVQRKIQEFAQNKKPDKYEPIKTQ